MSDTTLSSVPSQFSKYHGSISGVPDIRRVCTDNGELLVAVQGDTTKSAILTYHDLGLNCTYHLHHNKIDELCRDSRNSQFESFSYIRFTPVIMFLQIQPVLLDSSTIPVCKHYYRISVCIM